MNLTIPRNGQVLSFEGYGTASEIRLEGVEYIPFDRLPSFFEALYREMAPNATVEFTALNFFSIADAYLRERAITRDMVNALLAPNRRNFFDEATIASILLKAGFLKVWTGRASELASELILVKAIKVIV